MFVDLMERYPQYTLDRLVDLSWEQLEILWFAGKPQRRGIPISDEAGLTRAMAKMKHRKLRDMGII